MNKLDWSNGVQTRDGREAEVFAERGTTLYGRIWKDSANGWRPEHWYIDGAICRGANSVDNLIPLPKIEKRYANVHPNGTVYAMTSAPTNLVGDRIGVLAFTFRDGVPDVTVQPEWVR